jgi:hypothetical protein
MWSEPSVTSKIKRVFQNFRLSRQYRNTLESIYCLATHRDSNQVCGHLKDKELKTTLRTLPDKISILLHELDLLRLKGAHLQDEISKNQLQIRDLKDSIRAKDREYQDLVKGNQALVLRYEDLVRATTESNTARQYFLELGKNSELMAELGHVKQVLSLLRPVQTEYQLFRMGQASDGGYLVPDDFQEVEALFSPGVAMIAAFESDFLEKCPEAKCFQIDASVSKSPLDDSRVKFEPLFLKHQDSSENEITLESWVDKYAADSSDLILQMDIEGAEWEVLAGVDVETLSQFRIIVVEFHGMHKVFDRLANFQIFEVLSKLDEVFYVVHAHANNFEQPIVNYDLAVPPVWEVTYLRRDRVKQAPGFASLPNAYDRPNNPATPDIQLDSLFKCLDEADLLEFREGAV